MNREEANHYYSELTDLYLKLENDICKDSRYDCFNCEFGILRSEGDSYSCAVDAVQAALYYRYEGD